MDIGTLRSDKKINKMLQKCENKKNCQKKVVGMEQHDVLAITVHPGNLVQEFF